ncbi:hypothetical protein COO60DRAFT_965457 [Scenedesmus sp. NREL 46B-D3]|nr:hypothetical protein COO60DRAFT_965457 [Scenedesmus sp. NREL 46B-D3]
MGLPVAPSPRESAHHINHSTTWKSSSSSLLLLLLLPQPIAASSSPSAAAAPADAVSLACTVGSSSLPEPAGLRTAVVSSNMDSVHATDADIALAAISASPWNRLWAASSSISAPGCAKRSNLSYAACCLLRSESSSTFCQTTVVRYCCTTVLLAQNKSTTRPKAIGLTIGVLDAANTSGHGAAAACRSDSPNSCSRPSRCLCRAGSSRGYCCCRRRRSLLLCSLPGMCCS